MRPIIRWALEWNSRNQLDGERRFFMWDGTCPHLFRTREAARRFVSEKYGYINARPDLKAEPHGWAPPRVVKVRVELRPCG
jgi:hypothetical protein